MTTVNAGATAIDLPTPAATPSVRFHFFIFPTQLYANTQHFLFISVQKFAPSRCIVRFKPGVAVSLSGRSQGPALAALAGLEYMSSPLDPISTTSSSSSSRTVTQDHTTPYLFRITDGKDVLSKVAELSSHPDVAMVEPDYQVALYRLPSDPGYTQQWHLPRIGSNLAWDTDTGSKKVKVCVIDTGAAMGHPDLSANIIKGWNVVRNNNGTSPTPGSPQFSNYTDTLGHGTHVAGLIAAIGNNNKGVTGMTWRVGLLVCKFISDSGAGYLFDATMCLRLCRQEGAHVISNSWGGLNYAETMLQEIQAIDAMGGLLITAAGNDNINLDANPSYPASFNASNQLTVAATTPTDTLADFSNYGMKTVHIGAPGVNMLSTTSDGDYGFMNGTSMAAPVVAGAAALLQAMAMNIYKTQVSPEKIKKYLTSTVDKSEWGLLQLSSGGRINVARAVTALHVDLGGAPWPIPPVDNSIVIPTCGKSPLGGQSATANQSSVLRNNVAGRAVDRDCRNDMKKWPGVCSATDPTKSMPWWSAKMVQKGDIVAVSITTRSDCCWGQIGNAQILIGNTSWVGAKSKSAFVLCGNVPQSGIPWGQRMTIQCEKPVTGLYVAVYLPKKRTSLMLCEVDVSFDGGWNAQSSSSPSQLLPSLPPPSPLPLPSPSPPPPPKKPSLSPPPKNKVGSSAQAT